MNKMLIGNVCDYTQIRNIQNRATYVQRLFLLLVHDNFKGFNDNMVILKENQNLKTLLIFLFQKQQKILIGLPFFKTFY